MYERRYIEPNQKYPAILPHSEVCMHMGVAGKIMFIEWDGKRSVQLYRVECHGNGWNADDKSQSYTAWFVPFSAPILLGEAGVYTDEHGKPYQVTELTCPSEAETPGLTGADEAIVDGDA